MAVVTIVGRPNVGKSTLFNRLTKTNQALVVDMPGVTRDRQYGRCTHEGRAFIVVDTGGMQETTDALKHEVSEQAKRAVEESDCLLFVCDGREGLTTDDEKIAAWVRTTGKPILLLVNKTDGIDAPSAILDFHALGLGEPMAVAASHGRGIQPLLNAISHTCPDEGRVGEEVSEENNIAVALIGKPNVGKSTLTNRLLGEERMLVSDLPGTTRDSVSHRLEMGDQVYRLIDTAGIRRRSRVTEKLEKFSVIKSIQAIDDCDVVLFLIDAHENITDLDLKLLGHVVDAGKALVIALNKWDHLSNDQKVKVHEAVDRQLHFVDFAVLHQISALHGSGVRDLFKSIRQAYDAATKDLSTNRLTKALQSMVEQHPPPLVNRHRIKLRYAHMGGKQPPLIIIHGNQTQSVPNSYQRYLINGFRSRFALQGTSIRLEFKYSDNPFAGKKNTLTPRQVKRRQRIQQIRGKRK